VDKQRLGKLYYVVMLSRWQEAAVNKKYDMVLGENREMRRELLNTEQLLQNKESEYANSESSLQEKCLVLEQMK